MTKEEFNKELEDLIEAESYKSMHNVNHPTVIKLSSQGNEVISYLYEWLHTDKSCWYAFLILRNLGINPEITRFESGRHDLIKEKFILEIQNKGIVDFSE